MDDDDNDDLLTRGDVFNVRDLASAARKRRAGPSVGEGAVSGAKTGLAVGSAGGAWGAAIGTAAGLLGGALGAKLEQNQEEDTRRAKFGQFLQGKGKAASAAQQGTTAAIQFARDKDK